MGKKIKKSKRSKNKNSDFFKISKKNFVVLIVIIAFLFIVVLFGLLLQMEVIHDPLKRINSVPKEFDIKDECSLIVGKLIHTIKDEDVCELKCKTNCGTRELIFDRYEFIKKEGDCNECKCYCI